MALFWNGCRIAGKCPTCGSKRLKMGHGRLGEQIVYCLDCERDEQVRRMAQS